jgi:hypothetical protein
MPVLCIQFFVNKELNLLDEDPVDQDQGKRHDEQNVWKIENKFGNEIFGAVPFDVPVSDSNLNKKVKFKHNRYLNGRLNLNGPGFREYSESMKTSASARIHMEGAKYLLIFQRVQRLKKAPKHLKGVLNSIKLYIFYFRGVKASLAPLS